VDSKPDVIHVDQLTFILQYAKNAVPKGGFLQFMPIQGHKANHLADDVISFLKDNNISLMNCRGQSYNNAAIMLRLLGLTNKYTFTYHMQDIL
jgi:hypothetical protein